MGLWTKVTALLVGIALVGTAAWPLALALLAYPVLTSKRANGTIRGELPLRWITVRLLVSALLLVLAAAAFTSGATLSPFILAGTGILVAAWPALSRVLIPHVDPIDDTILLRSRRFPIMWHAVAEVRPSQEEFPRSMSGFTGQLVVRTNDRMVYGLWSCAALGRRAAEHVLLRRMGASASSSGALLLPLASEDSSKVLSTSLIAPQTSHIDFGAHPPNGVLLLEVFRGRVLKANCADLGPSAIQALPPSPRHPAQGTPLLWEVLESLERTGPWASPDSTSSFIESIRATRAEPIGERVARLETSGEHVRLKSLGGDEVLIARSQLRALVEIYP